MNQPHAPATLLGSASKAPVRRALLAAHPVSLALEPCSQGQWAWELGGRVRARGRVHVSAAELVGLGARLAALIGGHRSSAALVSQCGGLSLHVERAEEGGALVAFRVGCGTAGYSVGVTRLDAPSLQRAAESFLALFDAATGTS